MAFVVAAPDKFRGTASARAIADACVDGAQSADWSAEAFPMSDGGEGLLDAIGGSVRRIEVRGALGAPAVAEWRFLEEPGHPSTAVIEMAQASGISQLGGAEFNDALRASTFGTGQLIQAAIEAGAKRIIVGCGGSASTDGGAGAIAAITDRVRLASIELVAATDVRTTFVDAARVFAPQKGADEQSVAILEERLKTLAARYRDEFGVEIGALLGSGAAGGLAGGLAALGARIVAGFDYVAELLGLQSALERADAVVTGEGRLDATSFAGKVIGGVLGLVEGRFPTLVVVGTADLALDSLPRSVDLVSLSARFGLSSALDNPVQLVREVVGEWLTGLRAGKVSP